MAEEVRTMPEAAAYLKIHPATLKRWMQPGVLPGAKLGRRVLGRKQAVDDAWRQPEEHRPPASSAQPPEPGRPSSRPEPAACPCPCWSR
jgi:excisionase family DNA binding protein